MQTDTGYEMPSGAVVGCDFADALRAAIAGKRIARRGWNGANQWVTYSPGCDALPADQFFSECNREFAAQQGGFAIVAPSFTLKNAQNEIVPGWAPSQGDLFAKDWQIFD